ncbi:MAG: XRE family transcriptional regulator [Fimbriimonadaceae bacterium]|nr:XRE family transcriptional regulator [Fimbriimonadaceae bacterium]QYK58730.1 MAG: XRE family transcriptional regulator [Fimbriimonadaceae bacterium]
MRAWNCAGALRTARKRAGLTVDQASRAGAVSPATLKRWESGRHAPAIEDATRLMRAYGQESDAPLLIEPPPETQRVLRHHRLRAGLTLQQAAERSGLAIATFQRYETAARRAPPDELARAATAVEMGQSETRTLVEVGRSLSSVPSGFLALDAFKALQSFRARPGDAETALAIVKSLLVIGAQEVIRDLWRPVFAPSLRNCTDNQRLITIRTVAALVHAGRAAPAGLDLLGRQVEFMRPGETKLDCVLNMARIATASGRIGEAQEWCQMAGSYASKTDDELALLLVRVFESAARFRADASVDRPREVLLLAERLPGPLQRYVACVAAAEMFQQVGDAGGTAEASELCWNLENAHGYGSPVALKVRRRLKAVSSR